MDITYLGHSSFRVRGKIATVVTDPFESDRSGLKFPKHVEADVVTVSHHDALTAIEGSPFLVNGAGEYEIKGVGVVGIDRASGGNTIYRIEIDGVSIVHLGDLNHSLSAGEVDELDGVDILMFRSVAVARRFDASQAVQVINDIEPTIVIPMQYASLDEFLKEIGKEGTAPVAKFTITKDKLPAEMQW
jgi:L-ascorbate metabolism protein UlaG (beta-lactamase superfamily)